MGYKVFLSHSTKDMNLVLNIRNHLNRAGISVYLAEEDLQPGMNLPQKIVNNIKSSHSMLVVLTDTGIRSQFVNQEIGIAKGINQRIIPMIEKRVKEEMRGLLEGHELIIFDKTKPDQAIKRVSSYITGLKSKLELEMKKREEALNMLIAIIILAFLAIVLFYAFRKK